MGVPLPEFFFSEGQGSGCSTAGNPKRRLEPHPLPQEDHLNLNSNKQGIITKKIILWLKKMKKIRISNLRAASDSSFVHSLILNITLRFLDS